MDTLRQVIAFARDIAIIALGIYAAVVAKKQIDLKQSEVDAQKATVEHLRALQAPALARELQDVSQTVEKLAKEKRELHDRLQSSVADDEALVERFRRVNLAGIAEGCFEGFSAIVEIEESYLFQHGTDPLPHAIFGTKTVIDTMREKRNQMAKNATEALKGIQPELPSTKAILKSKISLTR
jgi:hypothetical protein